jgi:hypothetical protein
MINAVHDNITNFRVIFAGSRPATKLLAGAATWATALSTSLSPMPALPIVTARSIPPTFSLAAAKPSKPSRVQTARDEFPIACEAPPSPTSQGFFLSRSSPERQIFCPSSVSLFDLKARFFVPTRGSLTSSRAGAVKVGRHADAACSELARPYLDSSEHDGTLGAIGMTIRGEPGFGRGSVAPQPCIRWVQGPEP